MRVRELIQATTAERSEYTGHISSQLTDTDIIYPMAHTFGHQPNFGKRKLGINLHRHMETMTTPTRMKPDLKTMQPLNRSTTLFQSYVHASYVSVGLSVLVLRS